MNCYKIKYFKFIIIFFFVFISACSSRNNIDNKTLAKIYVDKLIVEEQYGNQDSLSVKTEQVFQKYSVTKKDFYNSIKALDYDKEQWEEFFKFSKEYLDTLKEHLKDEKSSKPKSSKFSKIK